MTLKHRIKKIETSLRHKLNKDRQVVIVFQGQDETFEDACERQQVVKSEDANYIIVQWAG